MNVLDVGCGSISKFSAYFKSETVITHVDIKKTASHLEAVSDIQLLPFKNNTFNIVYASHVLEHILNPAKAIKELARVSKRWVIILVPNASHYKATLESHEHIYSWNSSTLSHLLKRFFREVHIKPTNRRLPRTYWGKLKILKKILLTFLLKENELTAICQKEPKK